MNQQFVLYNIESPSYTNGQKLIFELFEGNIDWLMTYRNDSDIHVPYGRIVPKKVPNSSTNTDLFETKHRSIAWFVSNCYTKSKRELLAANLAKYIDLDIYGSCGPLKCPKSDDCFQMAEKNYKFYLSFENSLCKDYVTEKAFRAMKYNIIPIVYGSADYHSVLPDQSFIDASNFTSAKQLAEFLNHVSSDKELYNSYLNWKKYYDVVEYDYKEQMCRVCEKLHKGINSMTDGPILMKRDLIDWWYKQSDCKKPKLFN